MITQKTIDKYSNKKFGKIQVLEYSHNTSPSHIYFNCKCETCGSELKMRPDTFKTNSVGCMNCMGRWRSENFKKMYSHLKPKHLRFRRTHLMCQAKSRGYEWKLTDDETYSLIERPCYYCGTKEKIGLDRIDNNIGYEYTNCVPCCGYCNRLKMHNSLKDFITKVYEIYNNYIIESSTTILKGSTLQANDSGKGRHLSEENKLTEMKIWSDLHSDMQQRSKSA